ncbi:MAG: hypothetical protein GY786_12600 [Proteobacteria bacterium]|nr:hypothetical protein [Pseudomonadota bacterium]
MTLFVPGAAHLPAIVHSITLGFFVSFSLLFFYQSLPLIFKREIAWKQGVIYVVILHFTGTSFMISGFLLGDSNLVYWGGHYFVSLAIMIFFGQAIVTAVRSEKFKGKIKILLAIIGLMSTVGMGSMLAYDLKFGTYHIYHHGYIILHMLMGAFLFLVPMLHFPFGQVKNRGVGATADQLPAILVAIGLMGTLSIWYGWNFNHSSALILGWFDLLGLFALLIIQEKISGWRHQALAPITNIRIFGWLGISFIILLYLISTILESDVKYTELLVAGTLLFIFGPMIPSFLFLSRNYRLFSQSERLNRREKHLFFTHLVLAYWIVICYLFPSRLGIITGFSFYLTLILFQLKLTLLSESAESLDTKVQ